MKPVAAVQGYRFLGAELRPHKCQRSLLRRVNSFGMRRDPADVLSANEVVTPDGVAHGPMDGNKRKNAINEAPQPISCCLIGGNGRSNSLHRNGAKGSLQTLAFTLRCHHAPCIDCTGAAGAWQRSCMAPAR